MTDNELIDGFLAELDRRKVRIRFWVCPVKGHSAGDRQQPVLTVEWRGSTAYCLAPACHRTSADRYVPTSIAGSLCRGEYRWLPDDRVRACCLHCGALVDGASGDPVPAPHHCVPTPDPDLVP